MKKILLIAVVFALAPAVFAQKVQPKKQAKAPDTLPSVPSTIPNKERPVDKALLKKIQEELSDSNVSRKERIQIGRLDKRGTELANKYKDTFVALLEAKATNSEIRKALIVLDALDNIKDIFSRATKERIPLRLQAFLGLYETLAGAFAANEDIEARFEATNPTVVKILVKEIQKPIRVGWAPNTEIVAGTYIMDHYMEVQYPWVEELVTFNRDVLNANN